MRNPLAILLILAAFPVQADLSARFIEGAPKDMFRFSAETACLEGPVRLTVDLSGSHAGLIFDVTGGGAGVDVFQPFELVSGEDYVISVDAVRDGDQRLSLHLSQLPDQVEISFTIDLDDTLGGREITVEGAEISGARVQVSSGGQTASGTFGPDAVVHIPFSACAT